MELTTEPGELIFITNDAQLLHFPASAVRPQGRSGGGMAGDQARPRRAGGFLRRRVPPEADDRGGVVTVSGSSQGAARHRCGRGQGDPVRASIPAKGRATGGVRCHRFLKGEDALLLAWAGPAPASPPRRAAAPVDLARPRRPP